MRALICVGGGDFPRIKNGKLLTYQTEQIDQTIVNYTQKTNPKFLYIATASTHPVDSYNGAKKVYEQLGCKCSCLDESKSFEEIKREIFGSDIIYVGAGNTRHMLQIFKEKGIDKLLIQAYKQGIVCAGKSAGSYCWFKYNYDLIQGFGVINAINCVHYDQKDEIAKHKFYNVIKDKQLVGYAMDNCTAIAFIDNKIQVIKSDKSKKVWQITYSNKTFEQQEL